MIQCKYLYYFKITLTSFFFDHRLTYQLKHERRKFMTNADRYSKYLEVKAKRDALNSILLQMEGDMCKWHLDVLEKKEEGVKHIFEQGYKISITKRNNVTVNQKEAQAYGGLGCVKKYHFNKAEYNSLDETAKKVANKFITIKEGKPSFKIKKESEGENLNDVFTTNV